MLGKGKLSNLTRPLILTEKSSSADGEVSLQVQAVVRKKILFSTRPTPLNLKAAAPQQDALPSEKNQGEKRR